MKKTDKIAKLLQEKETPFPYYFFQLDEKIKEEYSGFMITSLYSEKFNGNITVYPIYKKHISRIIL